MIGRNDPGEPGRRAEPTDEPGPAHGTELGQEDAPSLLLAEERATVAKRAVVTDRVRVRTVTRTTEEVVDQDLAREDIEVVRVPVGREIEAMPAIREDGDVTVIPVVEEVLVVEIRLVLKEEVHIRRTRSVESVQTPIVLRKQEAVIERPGADDHQDKETSA